MQNAPVEPKAWLATEEQRNKASADLFTSIVRRAYGCDEAVLIGHHICFQHGSDIETENEVPAADSLIFDLDIMSAVFGEDCIELMTSLAVMSTDERDAALREAYVARYGALR